MTWYAMPAQSKVVASFQNVGTFGQRCSTMEFQDSGRLDDGEMWPVGLAIRACDVVAAGQLCPLLSADAAGR